MEQSLSNIYTPLKWIIDTFNNQLINYQLVGGVAANVYGSKRKINDIDFYIDFSKLERLLPDIKNYLTWGPAHFEDENWNISFLKLVYHNQKIEIGDINNCFIYSKKVGYWIKQNIDLNSFNRIKINDLIVKVMKKEKLIEYKSILERKVDLEDIKQLLEK